MKTSTGDGSVIITETTSKIEAGEAALVQLKSEFKDAELLRAETKEALASAGELDAWAASAFDDESIDLEANVDALSKEQSLLWRKVQLGAVCFSTK